MQVDNQSTSIKPPIILSKCEAQSSAFPPGWWALPIIGLIGIGLILFLFDPARHDFYPVCLFYKTTGLLCPGCGSLRALHQLLHGHLETALRFNALLVLSLPVAAWQLAKLALGKPNVITAEISIRPAWLWLGFGVVLAFGLLRTLPFAHLTLLAQ